MILMAIDKSYHSRNLTEWESAYWTIELSSEFPTSPINEDYLSCGIGREKKRT